MYNIKVATRYAKSVIELAQEQGKLEQVYADMLLIHGACAESKELVNLLESPVVASTKKASILSAIFGSKVDKLTSAFIDIIIAKTRESYLPAIATQFVEQYKAIKGIVTVQITTASPLSAENIKAIETKLAADIKGTIHIDTLVKEDLIGGFVLTVGDKQYDTSISKQLNELRKSFEGSEFVAQI